ncbi:MAG: hypothetical protein BWK80_11120 [Desulfobacteraceae bacterium IS3]|nr:MAG: hypothetical protein BWK80_11120 [Desulfobacteraceae bacterium IS3]
MEHREKKILLVDDEPAILDLFKNYLNMDRQLYGVMTAGNVQEAVEILTHEKISLVVSDIRMPGISGLDLLAIIRSRYPGTKVILVTGYGSPEIREEVKQSGCHFLEKPIELRKLRELINREISKKEEDGFGGTLKNIQLSDLIQMCCLSDISTAIRVQQASQEGTIFIEEGRILHAVCGRHQGEEAFYEILGWRSGSFETIGHIAVAQITIQKNWEFLLMEGVRRIDEAFAKIQKESERREGAEVSISKLRVLVADDSPIMCKILKDLIEAEGDITVVGTAKNGEEAIRKVEELNPDIVTLDVNMPVMDGSTALKHIMIKKPCPVAIIGATDSKVADILDFLRFGAVDFIKKPVKAKNMVQQQAELNRRIRLAAKARIANFKMAKSPKVLPKELKSDIQVSGNPQALAVISSGAGGYGELIKIIPRLPGNLNICIVVLQAMPQSFVLPLADYFNQRSRLRVLPLESDSRIVRGTCYIAANISSNFSLELEKAPDAEILHIATNDSEQTSAPNAFDRFLCSVADSFAGKVLVLLLSGADAGNMDGLRRIQEKHGKIITQKLDTCMIPEPLERLIREQISASEADSDEMIRQIMELRV